jgi:serine/threonine-protein kinase RsbT
MSASKGTTVRVTVESDVDIVAARQQGRTLAGELGFLSTDLTIIATVISELARNIVVYAQKGEIVLSPYSHNDKRGIVIIACDKGPGIPNTILAMQDGYSTSRSYGLGLPGVKRLVDDFEIISKSGQGTTVTAKKWLR